jgi:fibronectin type 3 domain-containing protein
MASALLLSVMQFSAYGADVRLSWNANSEPDLAGYKVYYGTSSRTYATSVNVSAVTTYTLTGLTGGTYYFAVTAYDTTGNESGFSNEVSKTITSDPPSSQLPAPTNVRVK